MELALLPFVAASSLRRKHTNILKLRFPSLLTPLVVSANKSKFPLACRCFGDVPEPAVVRSSAREFSVLSHKIPWEKGNTWTIMAMYMFNLHIPLGVCGLSVASYLLRKPILEPQTEAVSLLAMQVLELAGSQLLLAIYAATNFNYLSFFDDEHVIEERNWILASTLGFAVILLLIFFTSIVCDGILGSKEVSSSHVKEMLSSSTLGRSACALVYCFVTPLMEESMYRGFLLRSLASTMKWQKAVLLSSAAFSAAHFSGENFPQLFAIGCVLGSCYCWTGRLRSSFAIHSLYNSLTLMVSYFS